MNPGVTEDARGGSFYGREVERRDWSTISDGPQRGNRVKKSRGKIRTHKTFRRRGPERYASVNSIAEDHPLELKSGKGDPSLSLIPLKDLAVGGVSPLR